MEAKPLRITLRKDGKILERREVVPGDELRVESFTITIDESVAVATPSGAAPEAEIAQLWGDALLDVVRVRRGRVLVGGATACALSAPRDALPVDAFPLVVCEGGAVAVQVLERFALSIGGASLPDLIAAGRATAVRDGRLVLWRIALRAEERARLEIGGVTFLVRPLDPEPRLPFAPWAGVDGRFLGILATVGLLALAAGALTPRERRAPTLADSVGTLDRAVVFFEAKPSPTRSRPVRPPFLAKVRPETAHPDAGAGAPLTGAEGRKGKPGSKRETGGRNKVGALAALDDLDVTVFGGGRAARGVDDGDLIGDRDVADREGTGWGLRDDGPGGGGHMLTIDGLGPAGRGRGKRGDGRMPGVPGEKRDGDVGIEGEEVVLKTRIDPKLVEAAIARHLDAIRACYERRLHVAPDLAGKVVVHFEIAGSGRVAKAAVAHTTLRDRAAESCIVERVRQIQFPGFAAEGTVSIVYPFLFKTDGN